MMSDINFPASFTGVLQAVSFSLRVRKLLHALRWEYLSSIPKANNVPKRVEEQEVYEEFKTVAKK